MQTLLCRYPPLPGCLATVWTAATHAVRLDVSVVPDGGYMHEAAPHTPSTAGPLLPYADAKIYAIDCDFLPSYLEPFGHFAGRYIAFHFE